MLRKLQRRYALSEQGAKDLVKGSLACLLQNLSFMVPVGLLYLLVGGAATITPPSIWRASWPAWGCSC